MRPDVCGFAIIPLGRDISFIGRPVARSPCTKSSRRPRDEKKDSPGLLRRGTLPFCHL